MVDNSPASLSATNSFPVTVIRPVEPNLSTPAWSSDGFNFTVSGDNGPDYAILATTNLTDWLTVGTDDGLPPLFLFTDFGSTNFNQRFYQCLTGALIQ